MNFGKPLVGPRRIHWRAAWWCNAVGDVITPERAIEGVDLAFESIVEYAHALNDLDDCLIVSLAERAICPGAIDWAGR